jgi:hypothetical protein
MKAVSNGQITKPMSGDVPAPATIRNVLVSDMRPNEYNPNVMDDDCFAELVAEIRHLQRLPKPVVVRADGDSYVIVDGEHGWRAAKEAGLREVLCEVIEADSFEAMRQTYKRNQHGEHDPVLLGHMFRQMLKERQLSCRKLAEEICVSEGTVRNAILYAEAADLRNGYAFAELSVRQVRNYLDMPQEVGDLWLDSGADLKDLARAIRRRPSESPVLDEKDFAKRDLHDVKVYSLTDEQMDEIVALGFAATVTARDFVTSMRRAWDLLEWHEKFTKYVEGADALLRATAELHLPVTVLDQLPAVPDGRKVRVAFNPTQWADMLRNCRQRSDGDEETFTEMLRASVRLALKDSEFDSDKVEDPRALLGLREMPDYLRDADIPTWMKFALWRAEADVPDEVMDAAKRDAAQSLATRQGVLAGKDEKTAELREAMDRAGAFNRSPIEVLDGILTNRMRTREIEKRDEILDDREKLLADLRKRLDEMGMFRELRIGDRPASEVLWQRLTNLPWPELLFLACHVVGHQMPALARWIDAVCEELGVDFTDPRGQ